MKRIKNKKALSEIVSYVLLIVIAMALAAAVFSWVKFYIPQGEKEACPDEAALAVTEYSCTEPGILNATISNSGYFNIDGFFAKASNQTGKLPAIMLNTTNTEMHNATGPGRYDFKLDRNTMGPLMNQQSVRLSFDYSSMGAIRVLQIQPFQYANKTKKILLCSSIQIPIEDCG